MKENPTFLNLLVFKYGAYSFMLLSLVSVLLGIYILNALLKGEAFSADFGEALNRSIVMLGTLIILYLMWQIIKTIGEIENYDKSKEKIIDKYKKLGGNLEDLDKEETVGE